MANKVYNFSAGPSVLPEQALKEASAACIDYANSGISILSMSHRSKPIENMFAETEQFLRDLMGIPENYDIVWASPRTTTSSSSVVVVHSCSACSR